MLLRVLTNASQVDGAAEKTKSIWKEVLQTRIGQKLFMKSKKW